MGDFTSCVVRTSPEGLWRMASYVNRAFQQYCISNSDVLCFLCCKKQPQNLKPDWAVIWGMTVFMLVCIIMLVIAVIIWRPRSIGRYPIRALRPKYAALGAPIPVVPIPGELNAALFLQQQSNDLTQEIPT